jgi:hypothetical protein
MGGRTSPSVAQDGTELPAKVRRPIEGLATSAVEHPIQTVEKRRVSVLVASRRQFWRKLGLFLLPFATFFSFPLLVLGWSSELLPARWIAALHLRASQDALYGAAYSNPDKAYKLESIRLHAAPIVAVGTSRVMQFRANFFRGGEATFYNGGGMVARLWDYRIALSHVPAHGPTRYLLVGVDPWMFNAAWSGSTPDAGVEQDYAGNGNALDTLQHSARVYTDYLHGKFGLRQLFGSVDRFGVNAMARNNGFRHDGSYHYADVPADVGERLGDTLDRIRTRTRRFEAGETLDPVAMVELGRLLRTARERGLIPVVFLPPFAPAVSAALRVSPAHGYMHRVAPAVSAACTAQGVAFFDASDCEQDGCADEEFIDGFHGGEKTYARLLVRMAASVAFLNAHVDSAALHARVAAAPPGPSL